MTTAKPKCYSVVRINKQTNRGLNATCCYWFNSYCNAMQKKWELKSLKKAVHMTQSHMSSHKHSWECYSFLEVSTLRTKWHRFEKWWRDNWENKLGNAVAKHICFLEQGEKWSGFCPKLKWKTSMESLILGGTHSIKLYTTYVYIRAELPRESFRISKVFIIDMYCALVHKYR